MTTKSCNADPSALNSTVPTSGNLEPPTNSGNASANPLTNTAKPQTNTNSASANTLVTSSVLAERYSVGDRSVQLWIKRLVEECGVDECCLKQNSGNQTTYTAYCIELLDSLNAHRSEGKKIGQWFSTLAQQPPQPARSLVSHSPMPESDELLVSPSSEPLVVIAGVVPGDIALATDQQQSMLDQCNRAFYSPAYPIEWTTGL